MTTQYYTYDSTTKRLTAAPKCVHYGGHLYGSPKPEHYALVGAYPLADPQPEPEPPEGKVAVADGYALVDSAWVGQWRYEDAPAPVAPSGPYVYDAATGLYHELVASTDEDGNKIVFVEQEGVSL